MSDDQALQGTSSRPSALHSPVLGLSPNEPKLFLAPMEGLVDPILREIITSVGGVDFCVTEFIRVTERALSAREILRYAPELLFEGSGRGRTRVGTPVIVQFLGSNAQAIAESAMQAVECGALGIDLNFGCPAKTVNRHEGGAALLKCPDRIARVVQEVRARVPSYISVSAKMRLGFSDKSQAVVIAREIEAAGANWLTVHARTRDEGYRPPAHWEYLALIREALHIPVVANGEIWTTEDFEKCALVSGCLHFMLGRGLVSRPDLALQCRHVLDARFANSNPIGSSLVRTMSWPQVSALVSQMLIMAEKEKHEGFAVARTKQWLNMLRRNYAEAEDLFHAIKRFESSVQMQAAFEATSGGAARNYLEPTLPPPNLGCLALH